MTMRRLATLSSGKWGKSSIGMSSTGPGKLPPISAYFVFLYPLALETMKFEKINNKGQAQLFKNQYLEMLTKTHPLVIWGMYLPIIIYFLYYSVGRLDYPVVRIALVFLAGMLFWTFFEYLMHRYVFHMIAESPRARKFIYTLH